MQSQELAQTIASDRRASRPEAPVPIALVITDLDVGGAERALVALATGLDRQRWSPTVINLSGEGELVAPLRAAGIETVTLATRPSRPIQAVWKLARALRRARPPLVQSFLFHANVASRLAAPFAGWPKLIGGLRVAERACRWHLMLDRLTMPLAVGSVCVSEGVRRFSIEHGKLSPAKLTVIPNGINFHRFDRAEPVARESIGIPPTAFLVLFVGRIEPQKGLRVLLEATRTVLAQRSNVYFVLVGDGPERNELERLTAADSQLRDHVIWLGRRNDVPSLINTADLLVLPSLWEGMPNVVLEAMAAGRAVVATAVEGSVDLVVPDATGWLVPPGEPTILASTLLEAAEDPDRLRRFGAEGRRRVEIQFSQESVISAYDRLWSNVLGIE